MAKTASEDRNWYKVSTFILSIVALVVAFVSGVYYKRVDLRNQRLRDIDGRIDRLLDHREKLVARPKAAIRLLTLSNSGLPEAAFASLREVPAVLRVQHIGGATAKGITIIINASDPIVKVLPNSSLENYDIHLSEDKRTLTVDLPQLRQKALVDATIMARGVTRLRYTATIADGMIIDSDDSVSTSARPISGRRLIDAAGAQYWRVVSNRNAVDGQGTESPEIIDEQDIDHAIEEARSALEAERARPLLLPALDALVPNLFVGMFVMVGVILGLFAAYEYVRGRAARRQGEILRQAERDKTLKAGESVDNVRKVLGEPQRTTLERTGDTVLERWTYKPYNAVFFAPHPVLIVEFTNSVIARVIFENKQVDH